MKFLFIILPTILLFIDHGQCDKILIFMGTFTSHSPTASIQPLADKLATRGHKVTLYTPVVMPNRNPKVTLFCPPELKSYFTETVPSLGARSLAARINKAVDVSSMGKLLFFGFDQAHEICQTFLNSPDFAKLLEKGDGFDLVILDSAFHECAYVVAYLFKAKTAIYAAMGTVFWWDLENFGLPAELSWMPSFVSAYEGEKVSFLDRLGNVALTSLMAGIHRSYHLPRLEKVARESHLADRLKDMPTLDKLIQDTALYLVNQHHSHQFPRSYPPFVVQVGAMHVDFQLNSTLPKEIQAFIGTSEFMYISFGTFIKVSTMPADIIQAFFDVLGASTHLKFLWKWEGELPKNLPPNILFQKWFPQEKILLHPKIRGFITQGGQISIQQGVCHGVPMILCPVEADQDYNSMRVTETGGGIKLELAGLTKSQLEEGLNKILHEPSYTQNAKKLSVACKDRPMSAVDTAVWWVEYVLRTDDTVIMKPLKEFQPLWLQWNLDLWGFLFFLAFVFILVSLIVIKWVTFKIFYFIFKKPTSTTTTTKGGSKVKSS